MTLDALRLEVPDILEENSLPLASLPMVLQSAQSLPPEAALSEVIERLFKLNRSALTLLERQRVLQSFSEQYRLYNTLHNQGDTSPKLFIRFCHELANGFKRLLLQILNGRAPSRPHLAWCLYMAEHFLAQTLLRNYQIYQEPPAGLWRDSHLLYWLGEHQSCLDEPVAAVFQPIAAPTLRGIYQQTLLLALSNPFHLAEGECLELFSALAPFAEQARLLLVDPDDEEEGLYIDLSEDQPILPQSQLLRGDPLCLRRFELGPLLIALHEPAPLQSARQLELLKQVQGNWFGRQQRRHERLDAAQKVYLVAGLNAIHAQLLEQRPLQLEALMLDNSAGGARLLCTGTPGESLAVGQLLLLPQVSNTPILAVLRWRHQNTDGIYLGLRYLKGLPRPVWLRRAPLAQTHPGILQSTPDPGTGWHHGLWLINGQFQEGENLWLQLSGTNNQACLPLPATNMSTALVERHPLRLA